MMELLHSLPLLPLIILLLLPNSVSSATCDFPAVFNFGDSNSDTGAYSAAFGPVPPPYGVTFFGKPAGRFSDGRLIIDFIAERLGWPYLSAYLDTLGTDFSHGANFANASSTIIDQNVSLPQGGYSPFSFGLQLRQFLQFKLRSQLVYNRGGSFKDLMPKEEYFSQALFTVDIGQNDLTAGCFSNKSAEEYIPNMLIEFSRVIKSIYENGGRYFWIHNAGPLGCLPYVILRVKPTAAETDSAGCAIPFNKLVQQFNMMLNETVDQLRGELPLATLTYVDIYSAKYLLISQAQKYGFEQPLTSCCGYGGGAFNFDFSVRCGDTGNVNGTKVLLGKSCENPYTRVIWDGIHFTETANRWIFDQISGGEYSYPRSSLDVACRKVESVG